MIADRIPDSIRQLVVLQSGRLAPEIQHTLEAASIAGIEFSAASVAAALATETVEVERQCEQLATRQRFLRRVGVEAWPDGTLAARYSFLHALYQQLWHERVSPTQLQHYHVRIGERKELAYGERVKEIAAELAIHFEQGQNAHKAIHYFQQAGQRAVERSANAEAIAYLSRGLAWLKTLPDSSQSAQQELTLQLTMGVPLVATKDYTDPEVKTTYTRAVELGRQLADPLQLFRALDGVLAFCLVRAEHKRANQLAEQLLSLAQDIHDPRLLVEAHRMMGESLFWRGDLTGARSHFEQSTSVYNPQQHHFLPFLYGGPDIEVANRAITACTLWCLGYPDQALKKSHAALSLAQKLAHPFSQVFALDWAVTLDQYYRKGRTSLERAETLIAQSTEHGFPHSSIAGTLARGWALVEQQRGDEGIVQIRQGLVAYQDIGAELGCVTLLAQLAEAYGKGGQRENGLQVLAEALAIVSNTDERNYEAELYRLKGELILQKFQIFSSKFQVENPQAAIHNPQSEAEKCFLKSIEIARRQQAKASELLATVNLARLWQPQALEQGAKSTEQGDWSTKQGVRS